MSQTQVRMNEYWSRWAREYETYQKERLSNPGELEAWERVWAQKLPSPPAQVLDVGTGSGHVAMICAGLGHRVTGIDLADGMLSQARLKAGYSISPQFSTGDAQDPPFEAESYDAITARYVLWTLRNPEAALDRWRQILRPGGTLVVVDSLWFPHGMADKATPSEGEGDERALHFAEVYAETKHDLPVAEANDISDFAHLIESAGFEEVTVEELTEIYQLDQRYGVAPGHHVQMQYRITGRKGHKPSDRPTQFLHRPLNVDL